MGNADELIWQVDEEDRPLGPCRRGEAHRLGLRHRAAHVLVFNPQGEVFLQKRAETKAVHPGLWDISAAGHVDYGESYAACALRELEEELGFAASAPLQELFKLHASADTGWEFIEVYRTSHAGLVTLEAGQIDAGQWIGPHALDAWIDAGGVGLTPTLMAVWRRLRSP